MKVKRNKAITNWIIRDSLVNEYSMRYGAETEKIYREMLMKVLAFV